MQKYHIERGKMKEYCIFVICRGGKPYTLGNYNSFSLAKQALMNMISDFDRRKRIYYIDNDFWDNKYPLGLENSIYYQIQEREVTEWKKYKQIENASKEKCKILKFYK